MSQQGCGLAAQRSGNFEPGWQGFGPMTVVAAQPPMVPAGDKIAYACDALKQLLLAKNLAYGNSAMDPVRICSQASTTEQLLVRCDDKLSRLKRGNLDAEGLRETYRDLAGYFVLLGIAMEGE